MPPNKLAVFVEGQTEQIFVQKLVEEVLGQNKVHIVALKASGSSVRGTRRLVLLSAVRANPAAEYYVQIVDSSADHSVASDIRDNYQTLVQQDFKAIIGIRDVYPTPRADIPALLKGMRYKQKNAPIAVDNVLAVMEVEAWFLGEHNHLSKIGVPVADVVRQLGFDPSTDNMEDRAHPAQDLDDVYRLAGSSYDKSRMTVQATVGALDYEHMYLTLPGRMGSLRLLIDAIDRFLAS